MFTCRNKNQKYSYLQKVKEFVLFGKTKTYFLLFVKTTTDIFYLLKHKSYKSEMQHLYTNPNGTEVGLTFVI